MYNKFFLLWIVLKVRWWYLFLVLWVPIYMYIDVPTFSHMYLWNDLWHFHSEYYDASMSHGELFLELCYFITLY